MKKFLINLVIAGALLVSAASVPALAQEASQKSESAKPSMEIWKWANFAILMGVLGWLISKNVAPLLVARSKQIQEDLAAGERAKADAEVRASAVAVKLSGLGQAITSLQADARAEREREGIRIQRESATELTRIRQNAAFEIESATKLARLAVQRQAAKVAIDLAERKVRARMSPEVQAALLKHFLLELGSSTPAGKLS